MGGVTDDDECDKKKNKCVIIVYLQKGIIGDICWWPNMPKAG
jgi:hypothetical protein